jgi:hypothetical protein
LRVLRFFAAYGLRVYAWCTQARREDRGSHALHQRIETLIVRATVATDRQFSCPMAGEGLSRSKHLTSGGRVCQGKAGTSAFVVLIPALPGT